ncbi:MAG: NADH-quinone oxidoreductase subunit NuoF [Bacilli bacterium]|nr:NADH-quinone oxidoreductase subunit NuoF [Bacilli bacterium]
MERIRITVGLGSCGIASGAKIVYEALKEKTQKLNVQIVKVGCIGICRYEPIVEIYKDGNRITYINVSEKDVEDIIEKTIKNNEIIESLSLKEENNNILNDPFLKRQTRIVLENCGKINPENIDEYGGYKALRKALKMDKDEIIHEVKESKLRGRGGAGFKTGDKWSLVKASAGDKKYVCCNADEGDPGAFMDRAILEGDPHSVIEAMIIAGYAVGASEGFIYVREEYPLAVERLKVAIKQAQSKKYLGKNILNSGFNFNLELRLGAGAFVCGEETALMASIEGKRGEPRLRPPYPAEKGVYNSPTLLNNVETFANIPIIILNGSAWFNSLGTDKSGGTKVFALGGKIKNTGLVEVPIGTELKEIIYDIGGGIANDKKFKAAQTGGPSGGCIPASLINVKMDYDNLKEIGTMMGSGGLIVTDEDTCMVDIAKFFLDFAVSESCGKCTPCRIGTKRVYEILDKITKGKGTIEDLENLDNLSKHIQATSFCGLGQTATNPVLSTMRYFKEEYISHIVEKKCPAKVCKDLLKYKINKELCKACGLCAKNCPVNAIIKTDDKYEIDESKCIKCGACFNNCHFKAIEKE